MTTTQGTPCHSCPYGEQKRPFSIWCNAGEGMMGDVYWSGMLVHWGCKQNLDALARREEER